MDEKSKDRVSAIEHLRIEAHKRLTDAQRALSNNPADRKVRDAYADALHQMRKSADLNASTPDLHTAFDQARHGIITRKKPEKAIPALEHKPPGPSPMGVEQSKSALVSPQLREATRDRVREKALRAMRLGVDFRKAARDSFER